MLGWVRTPYYYFFFHSKLNTIWICTPATILCHILTEAGGNWILAPTRYFCRCLDPSTERIFTSVVGSEYSMTLLKYPKKDYHMLQKNDVQPAGLIICTGWVRSVGMRGAF
jgi:hypothetical protein